MYAAKANRVHLLYSPRVLRRRVDDCALVYSVGLIENRIETSDTEVLNWIRKAHYSIFPLASASN
jgi:hypothetical protein